MNDAQKKLLARALADLELLKCKFAVVDSDGKKHGDLHAAEKPEEQYNFRRTGYMDVIDAMVPGDMYTFENPYPGDPVALRRFAGSCGSRAVRTHGVGTLTTALDVANDRFTVKRVK